ncbi:hypothetical protein [Brumimicrobium mesophilum]|uniref:hypothetical protein n=1 Tax=Brumimicrobium mesophilum TaxID=392717 RepID=UPI000D142F4C|nr:hypothetical protein [Brumimicrobium mesophilum]
MKIPSIVLALFLSTVLIGFHPLTTSAQLIDNTHGEFFTDKPFFNEEVIRERGIKSISGTEIHYKLGDKPRETEYFRTYNFNKEGQLVQMLESVELTKEADTLVTFYDYDSIGNITAIRLFDAFGNYAYIYDYDEKGRVVNEEYRRSLSTNVNNNEDFELNEKFTVSAEKSSYVDFANGQKRIVYNSEGLPYKNIFTQFNRKGLVTEEVEKFERMPGSKITQFHYNHKSEIDSITVRSNIYGFQDRSFVFGYDRKGNLLKKEEFKNGTYVSQYQVLYDEETMLVDDVLFQYISTEFIKVIELRKYDYYEGKNNL